MRLILRLVATLALCVALIFAVTDATRSIAGSALVLTPLAQSWQLAAPEGLARTASVVTNWGGPGLWAMIEGTMLALPGAVVFLLLAAVLFVAGRRPQHRTGRISA